MATDCSTKGALVEEEQRRLLNKKGDQFSLDTPTRYFKCNNSQIYYMIK